MSHQSYRLLHIFSYLINLLYFLIKLEKSRKKTYVILFFMTGFRQYISEKYPSILEGYYKVGDFFGENQIKKIDSTAWNKDTK